MKPKKPGRGRGSGAGLVKRSFWKQSVTSFWLRNSETPAGGSRPRRCRGLPGGAWPGPPRVFTPTPGWDSAFSHAGPRCATLRARPRARVPVCGSAGPGGCRSPRCPQPGSGPPLPISWSRGRSRLVAWLPPALLARKMHEMPEPDPGPLPGSRGAACSSAGGQGLPPWAPLLTTWRPPAAGSVSARLLPVPAGRWFPAGVPASRLTAPPVLSAVHRPLSRACSALPSFPGSPARCCFSAQLAAAFRPPGRWELGVPLPGSGPPQSPPLGALSQARQLRPSQGTAARPGCGHPS